jgi:ABC-type phosphate/phosphonate transport system substrate-binding protein
MAILKKTILVFFLAAVAWFSCPAASAEDAVREFRIGLIGADPGLLLNNFDPFAHYLRNSLRRSGIRRVSVFVAKDLDQMRSRIQEGTLDFILTSAFPIIEMERHELVPAVVAVQGAVREESAVFFVRKQSSVRKLDDLRGKTVVFGAPWSTAGYALAKAELKKNKLSMRESTDWFVSDSKKNGGGNLQAEGHVPS